MQKNWPIRFQQALNHHSMMTFLYDIVKNVVLGPNAQIWLFGSRPPKNEKFPNLYISCKRSGQYASNKPSTIIQ